MKVSGLKNLISIQLLKSIFGVYLIVAVLVTATQLVLEFEATRDDIKQEMRDIGTTFTPTIEAAVFDLDQDLIDTILTGISENITVSGVSMVDDRGRSLGQVGYVESPDADVRPMDRQFAVKFSVYHSQENMLLAHVTLYSNNRIILNRLKYGFVLIIVNSFLKTGILWIVMIFFLGKYLAKPINSLIDGIAHLKLGNLQPVDFHYPYVNEISHLKRSFNNLISDLSVSRKVLKKHKDSLEQTVKDRTKELANQITIAEKALLEAQEAADFAKRAQQNAENASKAKSLFLSRMSHELRTPLNAIIGFSGLIAEDAEEDGNIELRADADKIASSGHFLLTIVNNILDITSLQSGALELSSSEVELNLFLESLDVILKPAVVAKGNKLSMEAVGLKSLFLDEGKLKQICINLLTNANTFTEGGKIQLTIEATKDEMIRVTVEDSGKGIPEHKIPEAFDMFVQVHDINDQSLSGTGLGLTVAKMLVELMGGTIDVESAVGAGTTIRVYLPNNLSHEAATGLKLFVLEP